MTGTAFLIASPGLAKKHRTVPVNRAAFGFQRNHENSEADSRKLACDAPSRFKKRLTSKPLGA